MEMVRNMVANGLGVSLLTTRPASNVSYDGKKIACRALGGNLQSQSVVLAYPAQEEPSELSQSLARIARDRFLQK